MSATPARWYFDYISPFAYLQWRRLKQHADMFAIEPVPILFAAVLDHLQTKGPAETPDKRRFTYRYVDWRARRDGVPLKFPAAHPFNPLAALRLSVALGNRPEAVDALFAHVWEHGRAADSAEALAPVAAQFGVNDAAAALADPAVKNTLRENTERAIARGVFGVPTIDVGGRLFWGIDALPMVRAALQDDAWFRGPDWDAAALQRPGVTR
jgi:2-hydroxychromene-2-carboxylate isomerase